MKKRYNYIVIVLLTFFLVGIIYPIIKLVSNLDFSLFKELVSSIQFKDALKNSLTVTSISTIISILLSYTLAYTICRTNIKRKAVITILLTLPMLIPSISHGLGLINLFGQNGIITNLIKVKFNIIGFNGVLLGSILYSFPVALLMFIDAFNYVDNSMYDAAQVLGLSKFQTFMKVTFYYLRKPILSAIFAIFTLIFTDYGIPLAVGGRYMTLPVFLYREVIGLLDYSKGTMIGIFLLIPALVSFIIDTIVNDKVNNNFVDKKYIIKESRFSHLLLKVFTYIVLVFLFVLFSSFLYLSVLEKYPYNISFSLKHIEYVLDRGILSVLLNSLIISLSTSILGTIIAYFSAYIVNRYNLKCKKIIHMLIITTLAIPGIVLGLAYMMAFRSTFIYRTHVILVLVNIVHFIASPYLIAYNALGKINKNYESIGMTCGVSRLRIIKDVIIPNSINTILEMFGYFFTNSMVTISAVTFLFGINTMPLSIMINQYEGQMMYEEAAIVSLIILTFNLLIKGIIYIIKRRRYNKLRGIIC